MPKKGTIKSYEVYIASYKGVVYYVGEGLKGRSAHVNSGISNCYLLNKLHHKEGVTFDVKVIPVKTKEEAKYLEESKIKELKPLGNKPSFSQQNEIRRTVRQSRKYLSKDQYELVKYVSTRFNTQLYYELTTLECNKESFNKNLPRNFVEGNKLENLRKVLDITRPDKKKPYIVKWIFKSWD